MDSDLEAAKLANDLKCPLISNDSDFLVMNIDEGVISCDSLLYETPFTTKTSKYYMECKVYKVVDFVNRFGLKPEMLPIFATLMGNDGMDDKVFEDLFVDIRKEIGLEFSEIIPEIDNFENRSRWLRISQLVYWLKNRFFSASQAIDFVENYLIDTKVDLKDFRVSIKSFQTKGNTFLRKLFDHKMNETDEKDIPIEEIVNEYRFPKWFLINYFYRTELDSIFFTLVGIKVLMLRPLIENFEFDSCFESCIELYAFLSGLLRLKRNDKTPLQITIRKGYDFEKRDIYPKTSISQWSGDGQQLPILSDIQDLSDDQKKVLLFAILKFEEKWMTDLEEDLLLLKLDKPDIDFWKYFLVVIKYWKLNTRVKHHFEFIRAIVYSLIYFRHKSMIKTEIDFNGLTSISKDRFKPFVSHYFCEFQAIYSIIKKLIALLGYPIIDAKLHHYLNGVLFYNLMNEIMDGRITLWPFKEHRLNSITNFIICAVC